MLQRMCKFYRYTANHRMKAAGCLIVTLVVVVSSILQCDASPAADDDVMRSLTSWHMRRRTVCAIIHFPPPNQHIYCCHEVAGCECPRRMGICAPEAVAAAENPAAETPMSSSLALFKRLFWS